MLYIYILLGLMALVVLLMAVMPKSYRVEKSIEINQPIEKVFNGVADLNNFHQWNPWQKMEKEAKHSIEGTPATVGHAYGWSGKKIGVGKLTVREIDAPFKVDFNLEFIRPWKSKANDGWFFEEMPNGGTKATWHNSGDLPFGIARLMGPMISKGLNKQFEEGLQSLKQMVAG
jgi:uncharacterized protein YndB with AHSA1/START domain